VSQENFIKKKPRHVRGFPCTRQKLYSLRQLLANAAIAASRVAESPARAGAFLVRPSQVARLLAKAHLAILFSGKATRLHSSEL